MFQSALYIGSVMHRRLRPRAHHLRYRVFWMLIDLDEVAALARSFRLFSYNHFNALSLYDKDCGDGSDQPLRQQVADTLRRAGISADGPVRMFCMPRVFGYVFNPLTVYFCHRGDGTLAATLYEVHNTFGERHSYLFPVDQPVHGALEQACEKAFYVSPFLAMDMRYDFRIAPPDDRVSISIRGSDRDGPMIVATLFGRRAAFTDAALLRVLASHPLLTVRVIVAIHWHALRMLLKGFRLTPRPATPRAAVRAREARP
jgi:uncharacterized protein